jgi:hypothetical protein
MRRGRRARHTRAARRAPAPRGGRLGERARRGARRRVRRARGGRRRRRRATPRRVPTMAAEPRAAARELLDPRLAGPAPRRPRPPTTTASCCRWCSPGSSASWTARCRRSRRCSPRRS